MSPSGQEKIRQQHLASLRRTQEYIESMWMTKAELSTVEKAQTNFALIALILVILIAIGAGAYLYKTGELEKLRQRLQNR